MTVTWATHEDHLCQLAQADLASDAGLFAPTLLVFDGDDAELMIRARPDRPRDDRDPLSELATYVAARRPSRVALAIPGRMRELSGWLTDQDPVRAVVSSSAMLRDGTHDHRARILYSATHPTGSERSDIEVEMSPVTSLLDDALRFASRIDARATLAVLMSWGHTVAVPAANDDASDDAGIEPPSGATRHQVHRLAVELGRRHTPTAPATEMQRRPAIITDIPAGWEAACPL